mgnify:CR=1 FL=1
MLPFEQIARLSRDLRQHRRAHRGAGLRAGDELRWIMAVMPRPAFQYIVHRSAPVPRVGIGVERVDRGRSLHLLFTPLQPAEEESA